MKALTFILTFILSLSVYAKDFKVREKRWYGGESLELQGVEKDGVSISQLFNTITRFIDDEIYIRLLSPLDETAESEILGFYKTNHSKNLKNGSRELLEYFGSAFEATTLCGSFKEKMLEQGYTLNKIAYEKVYVSPKSVSAPDITLYFSKAI